jgi:hypothetical protein
MYPTRIDVCNGFREEDGTEEMPFLEKANDDDYADAPRETTLLSQHRRVTKSPVEMCTITHV